MERGNREQDHRLGPGAASLPFPTQPPPPSRHHHQLRPDHAFLAPAAFEPAASQLPATSYAASNAQAVAANAADVFASPPDPVDFYRSYHAAPQPFSPTQDFMATAPPAHPRPSLSLRSNGGGASPKHAAPAPAGYARPRPALRSASNPVDDRAAAAAARQGPGVGNGYSGEAQTSVKDLKKRFDQTTAPPPPSRKPTVSRNPPRDLSHSTAAAAPPANGAAQPPYPTMRAGSVREPRERVSDAANGSAASRTTQRPKFLPEDHQQPSSNPQSFASRINQPRTSISANEQASKSMTHLSPQTSPRPAPSSPGSSRSNGLLFGEILPEQKNTATVGYGIDGVRPRRTSESNLTSPTRPRFPSDANADDEPPPRDWYRGMASPRGTRDQQTALRIPTNNSRTHSDAPSAASQPQPAPPPSSRLPLSVKKVTSPPGPSSPVSTGSNSPALGKRPSTGRTARQHHQAPPPTARAKTPTKRSATPTSRSKSSAHATSSSRKQPPGHITTPGNNRLNAYITAPPPKLSPPLRSSRPRQTVSSASTTSSRMKAVDRGRSPHGSSSRQGTRREESAAQKRKIEIGPVDFAQRRETIRLAYSKSIRETEARVARQAAAERRKREAEAAALREKAEAEAEAAAQSALVVEEAQEAGGSAPQPTLALSSTHPAMPSIQHLDVRQSLSVDSPTLGLPGTFPNFGSPALEQEEIPQSAISAHSAVTEFDTEAQTEPPVPESKTTSTNNLTPNHEGTSYFHEKAEYRSPFEGPLLEEPEAPPCEDERHVPETSSAHEKATYRYPFEDDGNDEDIDVKISLDTSASGSPQRQYELDMEPIVPGSFRGEFEAHHAEVQADSDSEPAPQPQSTEHDEQQRRYGPGPEPEEYEPQPFRSDSFQTTVTIVSRDSDFTPSASFSRQDSAGQTETQMDSLEHFYVGPSMRENVAALRDSTFAPSEFSDETPQTSAEIQRTPDTSNSLTIPSLLSPANRSSQQSGWTDFSMDSSDGPEFANKEPAVYGREHLIRTRSSLRRLDSRPGSIVQEPKFDEAQYSPELSPLDQSKPLVSYPSKHRLPELDTGDGFLLPYLADAVTSPPVPQLPDHDPPPVPTPDGRRTPSSGYYDQTRPSSYVQSSRDDQGSCSVGASRRGSEDYVPPMSTPHSVDQMSVDMSGQTVVERYGTSLEVPDSARQSLSTEKQEPPSKERSRLTQRQMVIRELIDTEAIFVRDMNIVEEIYKGTAEACPKLDPKTIKLIFRNTDEIITFHTAFLSQLKDSVASVYAPKGRRSPQLKETKEDSSISDATTLVSIANAPSSITLVESDDARDRQTSVGPVFAANVDKMRAAHEGFLRTSDPASKRLINIQEDPTVKVWLSECNEVAKDLTAAWNLDSLLIKPMQRITKYPNLISQLLQHTPADHPDREALLSARTTLENAILDINKTKKNFELVGQIVGRKRKESDVRAGFARAFGKRVDKLQATSNRLLDDPEYLKLHEKFGDDYLRLQVVLRDVEFYTRQVSKYVRDFLQYLSAMELVMRLQASPHPELEAKWALFNVSMRDMEKVALDQHVSRSRTAYGRSAC